MEIRPYRLASTLSCRVLTVALRGPLCMHVHRSRSRPGHGHGLVIILGVFEYFFITASLSWHFLLFFLLLISNKVTFSYLKDALEAAYKVEARLLRLLSLHLCPTRRAEKLHIHRKPFAALWHLFSIFFAQSKAQTSGMGPGPDGGQWKHRSLPLLF